jgi:hypothetical protein
MAAPITMPTINDLELILASRDERLFGYDELWQVPALLSEEDLLTIWNLADKVPVSPTASEFMRSLVREFGACIRVDKSQAHGLTVETGLCDGCHFNTAKSICNKVTVPLSVRAAKDLNRYSKALAWLLEAPEVSVEIVKALAPLVFWHRIEFVREELTKSPYYGNRFNFAAHLVELAASRFTQREPSIALVERLKRGEASKKELKELEEMARSDLIVMLDYVDLAKELTKSSYMEVVHRIEKGIGNRDVKELSRVEEHLAAQTDFPNRAMLLARVSEALHRLTLATFTLNFEKWQELWTTISLKYPGMTQILKETLQPPRRKVIRTQHLTLVVYVTGSSPDSAVFLEISGGVEALGLRNDIEAALQE